jgi:hypothetical protein
MGKNNAMQKPVANANFKHEGLLTGRELRRRKAREEKKNGKGSIRHRN